MTGRATIAGLLLILGGALAQAVNTVGVGAVRRAVEMEGASWLEAFFYPLFVFLTIAFVPTLALSRIVLGRAVRRGWVVGLEKKRARGTEKQHDRRLWVGYLATALIFGSTGLLMLQSQPLGMATLAANTGGFVAVVATLVKARADHARGHTVDLTARDKARKNLLPALLGLSGVVVAATVGQPFGVVPLPMLLLAVGWILLGILPLIQNELQGVEKAGLAAAQGRSEKLVSAMVTVKITYWFALRGFAISVLGLLLMLAWFGVPEVLPHELMVGALVLGLSYPLSQVLIQSGNGVGVPALNGPMMYLAVPAGYLLDEALGLPGFTSWRIAGTAVIVLAASWTVRIAIRDLRSPKRQG